MELKIITREEAKIQGLIKYFTGVPCKHGHLSERYVNNTHCYECRSLRNYSPEEQLRRKQYMKNYYSSETNRRRMKCSQLQRDFGITHDEYDKLLVDQNNLCWICQQPEPREQSLAVDHCHKTGEVRGLLCSQCNTGLGKFYDNTEWLQRAILYLSR